MKPKLIFILTGYQSEDAMGNLADSVQVELLNCKNAEEAIARAKPMVSKKFWRVRSIIEKDKED